MTETQERILAAIARHWRDWGYAPSFRDIQIAAALSSTSVVEYNVERLRTMGLLSFTPRLTRTIRLTPEGEKAVA